MKLLLLFAAQCPLVFPSKMPGLAERGQFPLVRSLWPGTFPRLGRTQEGRGGDDTSVAVPWDHIDKVVRRSATLELLSNLPSRHLDRPSDFSPFLQASSPTQYFWYRNTLDISPDIETPDNFNWVIAICLLVAWYKICTLDLVQLD